MAAMMDPRASEYLPSPASPSINTGTVVVSACRKSSFTPIIAFDFQGNPKLLPIAAQSFVNAAAHLAFSRTILAWEKNSCGSIGLTAYSAAPLRNALTASVALSRAVSTMQGISG